MPAWLLALIPNIWSSAKDFLERKQKIRELETNAEISIKKAEIESKIRRAEATTTVDGEIDKISVENTGWKDEYLTLLTTLFFAGLVYSPVLDVVVGWCIGTEYEVYRNGIPEMVSYYPGQLSAAFVTGIQNLKDVPEYAWLGLGAVYIHGLGMRGLYRTLLDRKSK